jgi:hypothetical protein
MLAKKYTRALGPLRRSLLLSTAIILTVAAAFPILGSRGVSAAQLTSRSLAISSGVPSASSVQYTFTFTLPSTSDVEGLRFTACTTAIGTYPGGSCSPPTALSFSSATFGTQSGWQGATNFSVDGTGANDCTAAANVLCAKRTDATAQTATSRTIRFDTITNPSDTNTAFFVGISTYDNNTWSNSGGAGNLRVDSGTTASATVQTLTINAAVAEVLNFCIGSSTVDDATTSVAGDCTSVAGTSINIGTLDTSAINVSPVNTNGGDNKNGVAMIRTNAVNGATVAYDAIQQSGTNHKGTLRISGATCNATDTDLTDQCIRAQGTTQGTFTAGTERYGMTIAGVNCGSTTSYTCTYSSGAYNLAPQSNYIGKSGNVYCNVCNTSDSGNGYAWDDTGTAQIIASSASSTTKVIDDETLILKFASTPSITTPFGAYTAQADFIAVATY